MRRKQQKKQMFRPVVSTSISTTTSTTSPVINITNTDIRGTTITSIERNKNFDGIMFIFDIDDRRIGNKERSVLFNILRSIVLESDHDTLKYLTDILEYYNTPKGERKYAYRNENHTVFATHISLFCDIMGEGDSQITPALLSKYKGDPFNIIFSKEELEKTICFMFHSKQKDYIHILSWHTNKKNKNDCVEYFIDCISFLKKKSLTMESDTNYFIVDIKPRLEPLCLFSYAMGFEVDPITTSAKTDEEKIYLYKQFKTIIKGNDFDKLHKITSDPRYRIKLDDGNVVIRLTYYPKTCKCAIKESIESGIDTIQTYQCDECNDVFYCTPKCASWKKCCK